MKRPAYAMVFYLKPGLTQQEHDAALKDLITLATRTHDTICKNPATKIQNVVLDEEYADPEEEPQ